MAFFDYYDFSPDTKDGSKRVKEEYHNYDVAILNIMNGTFIDLIHPDLQQEFLSS